MITHIFDLILYVGILRMYMIVNISLANFSITGTIKKQDTILNRSSKQKHQKDINIGQNKQQLNRFHGIFTIPLLIDIVLSRQSVIFCKYLHSRTAAANLSIRKTAASNRIRNHQNFAMSYLSHHYFLILFSPDDVVSYENLYTRP